MSTSADTLGAVLARAAADHPDGLALIDGGTRLTYAELHGCALAGAVFNPVVPIYR